MGNRQNLLIFDLDETLVHAAEGELDRPADFRVGPYYVYRRPRIESLLVRCAEIFQLAVWSTGSTEYVHGITKEIFADDVETAFVWGRDRCTRRFDGEWQQSYYIKDLKKVARLGYDLDRILIVDDTPKKVERQYGNAIYITPFYGDPADDELDRLAAYLPALANVPNVRQIEKRGWQHRQQSHETLSGQSSRVVLNLDDSPVTLEAKLGTLCLPFTRAESGRHSVPYSSWVAKGVYQENWGCGHKEPFAIKRSPHDIGE